MVDLPIEIHEAGLLLVVRTLPGSAHAIAAALDRARWPEVAGSIAGDDTLFVAFPDRGSLQRAKRRLVGSPRGADRAGLVTSDWVWASFGCAGGSSRSLVDVTGRRAPVDSTASNRRCFVASTPSSGGSSEPASRPMP